jgi:hypothetical protein
LNADTRWPVEINRIVVRDSWDGPRPIEHGPSKPQTCVSFYRKWDSSSYPSALARSPIERNVWNTSSRGLATRGPATSGVKSGACWYDCPQRQAKGFSWPSRLHASVNAKKDLSGLGYPASFLLHQEEDIANKNVLWISKVR